MGDTNDSQTETSRVVRYALILAVTWTVAVAASLGWSLTQDWRETLEVARTEARAAYEKDVVYRRWNAGHGGVYVPVTEDTPPNPYLAHVPERDVTTSSGRRLTLVNPAYMTRQVHELGKEAYSIRSHITSLKPIRPENKADPWETEALQAFERGEAEVSSMEQIEGQAYMRLMRPLFTEESCLKCHAAQGYKVGDIRGGISVAVPMAPLWAAGRAHVLTVAAGHVLLWLFGLVGVVAGSRRVRHDVGERDRAEAATRRRNRELALLNRVIAAANTTLEPETVLELTCRELARAFDVPQAAVAVLNETRTTATVVAEYLAEERPTALGAVIPVAGNPATQYVVEHEAPLAVADAQHDPRVAPIHDLMRQRGTVSLLILPLMVRGEVVGTIGLDAVERREFSEEEIALAASAAAAAAQALENARLYEAAQQRVAELETVRQASLTLTSSLELRAVLETILESTLKLSTEPRNTHIFLYQDGRLTSGLALWADGRRQQPVIKPRAHGLTYAVARQGEPIVVPDMRTHPLYADAPLDWEGAIVGLPLKIGQRVVGVMNVAYHHPRAFPEAELRVLRLLADQAAIAIENARLYERAQDEIAERKRAEEQVLRQSAVLDAINEVFRETLTCETDEEVARTCLAVAEELTGSKFGFIGEVNQAGRFDTIALSDPGWDACRMSKSDAVTVIKDMEIRGIWSRVLEDGQSRIVNDPVAHPDSVGTPEGHPPLTSFLGVPLKHAGRTIGMIGLANKESGYDLADQQDVEPLSVAFVEALNRKRAEEALRESEEKYRSLVNTIVDLVFTVDVEGNILFANPSAKEFTGREPEETIGHNFVEYVHPDDVPRLLAGIQQVLSGEPLESIEGIGQDIEHRMVRQDGQTLWVATRGRPVRDTQGNIVGFSGIVRDTTERKRAEEALRESEEKYRTLFEESKDVVFISTPEGRFVDINPAGVELFGYASKEELLQLDIARDLYVNPSDRETYRRALERDGYVRDYEVVVKRKDDQQVFALVTSTTVRDDEGNVVAYRGILRDVTEQRMLEQQFIQAQKMESIGTLAGGIAHDFNNILVGILGYASLMKKKMTAEHPFFKYIEVIEQSARRAAELTGQLLAFARGGKYQVRPVAVNDVVRETLRIVGETFDRAIDIEARLADGLPAVEGDAGQIQQVLMNLCVNARDAMPEGGKLTIETEAVVLDETYARTHLEARAGRYVTVSVTDTGVGIDEETAGRVFEPFFTTKEGGTGLGLAMVYGVVRNHGGFVRVYSEPGEGSTFRVYLPAGGKAGEKTEGFAVEGEPPRGRGELVLVVDDERAIRAFVRRALESYGYRVLLAENGAEAVEVYRQHEGEIGLVILDMVMPRMGGRETFLRLQEIDAGVKALLSTGFSQNEKAQAILDSGVMGFIQKPFEMDALLFTVRRVLDSEV